MYTKIVIFGSRAHCRYRDHNGKWQYDNDMLSKTFALLDVILKDTPNPYFIVGKAEGSDMVGMYYAISKNLPYQEFIPDWDKEPRRAGMIRNAEMRKVGEVFIGFWDGESRGTKEMFTSLKKTNRNVTMYTLDNELMDI